MARNFNYPTAVFCLLCIGFNKILIKLYYYYYYYYYYYGQLPCHNESTLICSGKFTGTPIKTKL